LFAVDPSASSWFFPSNQAKNLCAPLHSPSILPSFCKIYIGDHCGLADDRSLVLTSRFTYSKLLQYTCIVDGVVMNLERISDDRSSRIVDREASLAGNPYHPYEIFCCDVNLPESSHWSLSLSLRFSWLQFLPFWEHSQWT
jgi:hypothetical protein